MNQEDPTDHETEVFNGPMAAQRGLQIIPPEDGALISGLYFEGCRWDYENKCIAEQHPKQLFSKVPVIWLLPKESRPVSPATIKTKQTGNDTANVSIRAGVANQAQSAFRRNKMKSENFKQETESSNIEGTIVAGVTIDPNDNFSTNDPGSGDSQSYECPLYRTTARYGTLLTTGHSTNKIMMINTPMPSKDSNAEAAGDTVSHKTKSSHERTTQSHWVKRGAAMICSLSV